MSSGLINAKREIRHRLDELFFGPSPGISWGEHIDQLNLRLNPQKRLEEIPPRNRLMTPTGTEGGEGAVPPEWFIGDFELFGPNEWVLVLSLNPRIDSTDFKTMAEYRNRYFSPAEWRHHLQRFNLSPQRNLKFVRPLATLAQHGMNSQEEMWTFATERMLFLELCPYSSQDYQLDSKTVNSLASSDPGFLTVARIRDLLISEGKPRFILVNGAGAVNALNESGNTQPAWTRRSFASLHPAKPGKKQKELWVEIGTLQSIPILGFCQLNSRDGHNPLVDRERLKELVRNHISGGDA